MLLCLLILCLCTLSLGLNPYADDPDIKNKLLTTGKVQEASNWAVEGYFHPHEALRRDLYIANRTLQKSFDPLVPWHIKSFFEWFNFEVDLIHGHHWAEETIMFPAIVAHAPDMPMPPRMANDHRGLIQYLQEITNLQGTFEKAKGDEARLKQAGQELKSVWLSLANDMQEHFDEEENVLIPMILHGFPTQQSFGVMVKKLLREFDPWALLWEIPPIVGWMPLWCVPQVNCSAGALQKFRARIPRPVLFLTDNIMGPRWEDSLRTLQGIERGVEVPYAKYSLRSHELAMLGGVLVLIYVIYVVIRTIIRAARGKPGLAPKEKAN